MPFVLLIGALVAFALGAVVHPVLAAVVGIAAMFPTAWGVDRYRRLRRASQYLYDRPTVADGTVSPHLVAELQRLGDSYGPRGVAEVAAELTERPGPRPNPRPRPDRPVA
jgi:hypothetical protein